MKLTLPPLTRACVVAFTGLTLSAVALRYAAYSRLYDDALKNAPPESDDDTRTNYPLFSDTVVPYLTFVPALSILYPWTLLTASFVEFSILGMALSGTTLALCGRYLERIWTSRDFALFLAIVAIIPNLLTAFELVALFTVTGNEGYIISVVSGGAGLQAGFLVAFKQLVPEHAIVFFQGALRAHVKHLVLPALVGYSTLGLMLMRPVMVLLPWNAFFTAWIYLRFYKVAQIDALLPTSDSLIAAGSEPQAKIRGDASDTFALANFFYPEPLRQVVALASDAVFSILVTLRVCTPFNSEEVDASNLRASIRTGSVSEASNEADRRRALALRVLEERLQK